MKKITSIILVLLLTVSLAGVYTGHAEAACRHRWETRVLKGKSTHTIFKKCKKCGKKQLVKELHSFKTTYRKANAKKHEVIKTCTVCGYVKKGNYEYHAFNSTPQIADNGHYYVKTCYGCKFSTRTKTEPHKFQKKCVFYNAKKHVYYNYCPVCRLEKLIKLEAHKWYKAPIPEYPNRKRCIRCGNFK